jgi:hypothetical protein
MKGGDAQMSTYRVGSNAGDRRATIQVEGLEPGFPQAGLLCLLEELLPVDFRHAPSPPKRSVTRLDSEFDALFFFHGDGTTDGQAATEISLDFSAPSRAVEESDLAKCNVVFSDDCRVPFPFRGRSLSCALDTRHRPLELQAGDVVLASTKAGPVWSVAATDGKLHFKSALPWPARKAGQGFADLFCGNRFLEMLFMLHFLRACGADGGFKNAPLRATFIFDDPNLHWPRYGYVDYREIAIRAKRENYHACFATIPFDGWFIHQPTAAIFKQESRYLSLLAHGNNHVKQELAKTYSEAAGSALVQQALQRIAALEEKSGVKVCRVMVPPHGACASGMLRLLRLNGFEAACISAGSIRAFNQQAAWSAKVGFAPAEVIEDFAVLPRWAWNGEYQNALLVAAYLGQALVLRGHHQDLKNGVEVLDELARFVNGLGSVTWHDMDSLCRMNYQIRHEGTACHVRLFGTSVDIPVGEGMEQVFIADAAGMAGSVWTLDDGISRHALFSGRSLAIAAASGSHVSLIRQPPSSRPATPTPVRFRTAPSSVLRRLLTETRDRLMFG